MAEERVEDDALFVNPIKISKNKWVTGLIREKIDDEFVAVELAIATIENDKAILDGVEREEVVELYRSAKSKKVRKELWDLLEATSYGKIEEE